MGLEKLLEWLLQFLDRILPFETIEYYNRGVRLRFGIPSDEIRPKFLRCNIKTKAILYPGWHWKIPIFDVINTHMVQTTTMMLSAQTITTKDNRSVVIETTVKYKVKDVRTLLLEVNDPIDAISDTTKGLISDKVASMDWLDLNATALKKAIQPTAKIRANEWGIEIIDISFPTLAQMSSIRLVNGVGLDLA